MVEARIISQKLDFITTSKSTWPIRMATSTSTRVMTKYGMALPRKNSPARTGSARMVSMVPFSYSRAMTSEVSRAPDDHDDDGDDAGYDEVAAFEVLVEPDPEAALDGRPDPLPALAV